MVPGRGDGAAIAGGAALLMTTHEDSMARAGAYVLGLMDDEARERAERDMLVDPEFLACVARFASRMPAPGQPGRDDAAPEAGWQAVAQRLADLPQMKGSLPPAAPADARKAARGGAAASALGGRSMLAAGLLVALCIGYAGGLLTAPLAGACATLVQTAASAMR